MRDHWFEQMLYVLNLFIKKRKFLALNLLALICVSFDVSAVPIKGKSLYQLDESTIDEITLAFSPGDMRHFEYLSQLLSKKNYKKYNKENVWRKAPLHFNGRVFDASVKRHGKSPTQHSYGQLFHSYTVKLKRGQFINGYRRFKLFVSTRFVYGMSTIEIGRRLGVITQEPKPVVVHIPLYGKAHYAFTPPIDDKWIETKGYGTYRLFQEVEGVDAFDEHDLQAFIFGAQSPVWKPDDVDGLENKLKASLNGVIEDGDLREQIVTKHRSLNLAILKNDTSKALDFFELEYITDFLSALILSEEVGHMLVPGNLRVFYDLSSGRFFPMITYDAATQKGAQPDEEYWGWPESRSLWANEHRRIPFLAFVLQNDAIRLTLFEKLLRHIENDPDAKALNHVNSFFLNALGQDLIVARKKVLAHLTTFELKSAIARNTSSLLITGDSLNEIELLSLINENCPNGQVVSGEIDGQNVIKTKEVPDLSEGCIHELRLESSGGANKIFTQFSLNADRDDKRRYRTLTRKKISMIYRVPDLAESDWTKWKFKLNDTARELEITETEGGSIDKPNSYSVERIPKHLLEYGSLTDNEFAFHRGRHVIDKIIEFPLGLSVRIDEGTQFLMRKEGSLIINGSLEARGTAGNPIRFLPDSNTANFGVFAILGSPKTSVNIEHLELVRPSELTSNGRVLSGGLTIYRHNQIGLSNIKIFEPKGEDGLNIKYADSCSVTHLNIRNPFSDGLDIDKCPTNLKHLKIEAEKDFAFGNDGLDFSLANFNVKDAIISGFSDKGISVGEASKVVLDRISLKRNNIGIAVKDSSCLLGKNLSFENNAQQVSVYNKKQHFASGRAYFDNITDKMFADKTGVLANLAEFEGC